MTTINVSLLDDDVIRQLEHRAACNNRSLEGEVRHILKDAVRDELSPGGTDFLARTEALWNASEGCCQTPSERLIREDRDHGH